MMSNQLGKQSACIELYIYILTWEKKLEKKKGVSLDLKVSRDAHTKSPKAEKDKIR